MRENAKSWENQLASQSLAYGEAKESLQEERQCRAQLEWQLLSCIKVSNSFISKHLFVYRIRAYRTPLLIRTPGDTFWAHIGHFRRKIGEKR